jgi:lysophospholipid acyltransferase (LPLAT)-like uncharacterized protein
MHSTPTVTAAPALRRSRWRRWRKQVFKRLAGPGPLLLSGAVWALSWTLRKRLMADELFARWARGERVIVAFWHSRLLMMPIAARDQPICIMNSEHRDGEVVSRAFARWGVRAVRGSATRGGAKAFLQLINAYRQGYNVAIVPDGPRGPSGVAKPGVIHLARLTGAVIVPVSNAASRARHLHSWDRLVIPLPFSRLALVAGEPLTVPPDASPEDVERYRQTLEQRLHDVTRAAEAAVA